MSAKTVRKTRRQPKSGKTEWWLTGEIPKPADRIGLNRALDNIRWIEKMCVVPEGKDVGKPMFMRPWQRQELVNIYANKKGTRRAILSFARKNGKTAIAACLLLLHLCGPEHRVNSQLYSAAQSRDQAALLFGLAAKMVRLNPRLNSTQGGAVQVKEATKTLFCERLGTRYVALSADASTNFGLSPVFIVHDELGQVRGPRSQLYEALETATGAQEDPLSIVISTQAPGDNDLLSILIDDAQANHDPRVVLSLYTAPIEDDAFADKTIKLASPAYGDFLNPVEVRSMAEDARRMPAREAEFRNLILNQRVEAVAPFVTPSVWKRSKAAPGPLQAVFGGLDLSTTTDLTSLVLVSPREGSFDVHPVFWLPELGLEERSRNDRVPYDLWASQGLLETTPGNAIEYEYVAKYIAEVFATYDVRKIAFDRYNMRHLRPWLVKAGLSEDTIDGRFVDFGQGYVSMGPAVSNMEALLAEGKLRHGEHPVLTMCAMNSTVAINEVGWKKLDKKRSRGRIDGMVALTMACSVAGQALHETPVFSTPIDDILEDMTV
jgi:phage terminase large subunit-like protein